MNSSWPCGYCIKRSQIFADLWPQPLTGRSRRGGGSKWAGAWESDSPLDPSPGRRRRGRKSCKESGGVIRGTIGPGMIGKLDRSTDGEKLTGGAGTDESADETGI